MADQVFSIVLPLWMYKLSILYNYANYYINIYTHFNVEHFDRKIQWSMIQQLLKTSWLKVSHLFHPYITGAQRRFSVGQVTIWRIIPVYCRWVLFSYQWPWFWWVIIACSRAAVSWYGAQGQKLAPIEFVSKLSDPLMTDHLLDVFIMMLPCFQISAIDELLIERYSHMMLLPFQLLVFLSIH